MLMSQYLLSVWGDPAELEQVPPEAMQQAYEDVDKFNQKLQERGAWVFAGGLHTPDTATVVRVGADGEVQTIDGPYAEAKEHIGGFWVIQAEDLDAALAWAEEATVACQAPVEVRPFQDE
jgi:hypothetical protein